MDFGKYQYEASKKLKKARAGAKPTETKSVQIKIGTGDHDLELKAQTASKWLKEGHRIKVELYLSGPAKYMDEKFLKTRLDRLLHLITEDYKMSDTYKRGPRGLTATIEKNKWKEWKQTNLSVKDWRSPKMEKSFPESRASTISTPSNLEPASSPAEKGGYL